MIEGDRVFGLRVTPARRLAFFVGVDTAIVLSSLAMAIILRFDSIPSRDQVPALPFVATLAVVSILGAFHLLGIYRAAWSFMGLRDIARIAAAVALATLATGAIVQAGRWAGVTAAFPRTAILIAAPLTFCGLAAFRLARRGIGSLTGQRHMARGVPTLLVGAGEAGAQLVRSIQSSAAPYDVRGFLDDDPLAPGTMIHGVQVLGPVASLEGHVARLGIEIVVISMASATSAFVQEVVRRAKAANVLNVRIVPSLSELVDGHVSISATREVKLEDLLGREAIRIDGEEVRGLLAGKRVLVTGGAGTIGGELCRQIARFTPARLVILDVDETRLHDIALDLKQAHPDLVLHQALVDVRDAAAVDALFTQEHPEIVFHAAAYKHVPMMEMYPIAALHVNVLATHQVVAAAARSGTQRFVLISTDKAVEPSSVMGASKRLAELVLFAQTSSGGRTMIRSAVRFGNVVGSRGSLIPTFERQLANGGPLTVTHPDMQRFFMMTSEAVSLVLQAAGMGEGEDIFVLDMGKPVRILDVARDYIRLHGLEPGRDIDIAFTGLRAGEKMFELLTYPSERPLPTRHSRLKRVDTGGLAAPPHLLETVRGLVEDREPASALEYLRYLFPSIEQAAHAARTAKTPSAEVHGADLLIYEPPGAPKATTKPFARVRGSKP